MAKRDKTVTVELLEPIEQPEGCERSDWEVTYDGKRALIVHPHTEAGRRFWNCDAWYWVESPSVEDLLVHSRDFNAALAVARRMLGVRS